VALEYPLETESDASDNKHDANEGEDENEVDEEDDFSSIKHKIERRLVDGLPVLLNLLNDSNGESA